MMVPAVRVKRTHQHTENYKSGEDISMAGFKMTYPVKILLLITRELQVVINHPKNRSQRQMIR